MDKLLQMMGLARRANLLLAGEEVVADAIAEAAGAETAMFHTCHNVSPNELAGGETYVTLMRGNLERLRAHLNER